MTGELVIAVITRARAAEDLLPLHPACDFLIQLMQDDAPVWSISTPTIHSLRRFVDEMRPDEVRVLAGEHEDPAEIVAHLGAPRSLPH